MKKLNILSIVTLFILSAMMAVPTAQAQVAAEGDMEIGFVDPRAILQRMPEMSAVRQRLQNLAERKQSELAEREQELQSEVELYQQKVGVISEEARQKQGRAPSVSLSMTWMRSIRRHNRRLSSVVPS